MGIHSSRFTKKTISQILLTVIPKRSNLRAGMEVQIETKANQGTGRLTAGIVREILTTSASHPYGIKVRLQDSTVGRVKKITKIPE